MCVEGAKKEMLSMEETTEGIVFPVRVQPRAKQNEIAGIIGAALKVRLTAPPVEGAANEQCRKLLAEKFRVNVSHVVILSGLRGRQKRVMIAGITRERLLYLLQEMVQEAG